MRTCGECQWCCMVFRLPVLDKPAGKWCRFIGPTGCQIYPSRPEVCRKYACYWLDHEELANDLRPDRIGVVLTECGTVTVGGMKLRVMRINKTIPFIPVSLEAQLLIDRLVAQGWAVMVIDAEEMQLAYDRDLYASVSAQDIETAYRYEQSQDADELKRLGAVSEDYRTLTWAEAEGLVRRPEAPQ
jgi:hypothetical protein